MRPALETLVTLAGRLPRHKIEGQNLRLNLGSSTVVAPGWLNFDLSPNAAIAELPEPALAVAHALSGSRRIMSRGEYVDRLRRSRFVFCDLTRGIPVCSGAVEFVYSSHFIEHLKSNQVRALMLEVFRVLQPGGVLRITCPDLGYAVREYVNGNSEGFVGFLEGDHGFHGGPRDVHRSFWDVSALQRLLGAVGFVDITERRHHVGETPDLHLLETHAPMGCLFVEARKFTV